MEMVTYDKSHVLAIDLPRELRLLYMFLTLVFKLLEVPLLGEESITTEVDEINDNRLRQMDFTYSEAFGWHFVSDYIGDAQVAADDTALLLILDTYLTFSVGCNIPYVSGEAASPRECPLAANPAHLLVFHFSHMVGGEERGEGAGRGHILKKTMARISTWEWG
ncbi:hypothetical protein ACLOJK_012377 [Asimina triloba]